MALSSGTKPTAYNSVLTGLSLTLYNKRTTEGINLPEAPLVTAIGSDTFTEETTMNRNRILKAKLDAWVTADSIISDIKLTGVVTVALGIPVSTTGSAAAQTGTTTSTGTGTIS